MKRFFVSALLITGVLFTIAFSVYTQEEARAAWQVSSFDITANVQQPERTLNSTAVLNVRNVGRGSGNAPTFRIASKALVKSVNVAGANATYRSSPEARGTLQRITVNLPTAIAPNGNVSVTIAYTLPVETNGGLAAISPLGSQFLPLSFWYPAVNTPYTVRGADTAPFRLTVPGSTVISSGIEKSAGVYDQPLYGQPFFVQGDWDRIDGIGEGKGVTVFLPKGSEDRKQAEALISLVAAARTFYSAALGPAPDVPVRLVTARRGAGFDDSGTILIANGALRRPKIDAATALLISEAVARLCIGGQTAVRGEGSGVLRDGLVRFLAVLFIEKQFGREATQAELQRERLAYAGVAKRDVPLSRASTLDDTYLGSVPNKGAMVWRIVDRRVGREGFMSVLRAQLLAGKDDPNVFNLAGFRNALVALPGGGQGLQTLLEQQLDQVTDMDLLVGLPQQRGSDWVSALRNIGSTDATVSVVATTEQGQQVSVDVVVPGKNFAEAVFKTTSRPVRVEVDPDKLYPQLDYANDVAPRGRDLADALNQARGQIGAQDYARAEAVGREILVTAPRMEEARVILARALLGQNKIDEAEKMFRAVLEEPLPTAASMAWANIGLGEISLKRGQAADAAKRFNDAVRADGEYASSLMARAGRIRAEANSAPVDESAKAFVAQLDQTITGGKKADLDARVIPGELVRFVNGLAGTPTEIWQTRVLRTEALDANMVAADVAIRAKQLGQEQSGTAVLLLARSGGSWKLAGIELFEVH